MNGTIKKIFSLFVLSLLIVSVNSMHLYSMPENFSVEEDISAKKFGNEIQQMDWFSKEKDSYRDYTPEDIRKIIPKANPFFKRGNFNFLNKGEDSFSYITKLVFYTLLIALLLFISYLIYLQYKERVSDKKITSPVFSELIHTLLQETPLDPAQTKKSYHLGELPAQIDHAILTHQTDEASILIYIYILMILISHQKVEYKSGTTAREYLSQYKKSLDSDNKRNLFAQSIHLFEESLYGESKPEMRTVAELWQTVRMEFSI